MKAITVQSPTGPAILQHRLKPALRPGYMLVKTYCVALNPADHLLTDYGIATPGSLLGCDYSGIVEAVGEGVRRSFKVGDRVAGVARPMDPDQADNGAFAEYVVVKADLQLHLPDSMSFEQGCTFGVTSITTGRCLFDKLNIDYSGPREKEQLLVYGGSSAMGTMIIQFAKLANLHVLSTGSASNKALVSSYGADFVVDHYSATAVEELIQHAKQNEKAMGKLRFCIDCIGQLDTPQFCARVLHQASTLDISRPDQEFHQQLRGAHEALKTTGSSGELVYSTLMPFTPPLPDITVVATLGYSFLGEDWEQGGIRLQADMEAFEKASRFAEFAEQLIESGKLRSHPIDVRQGGLEGIIQSGLSELRAKKVSGKKLVFPLV